MLRAGQVIALCVIALLTIGVVMVNSAGMSVARVGGTHEPVPTLPARSIILSRSTVYMALAIGVMGVGAMVPVRRLAGASGAEQEVSQARALRLLALASIALLLVCALVYVPGLSNPRKGANRWIEIPGIGEGLSVQPSEVAKWAFVALIAWYATARRPVIHEFWRGLVPALAAVGMVTAFIVLEDLGTGALIAAVAAVVLVAAGARLWHFLIFVPVGALGLAAAILKSEYRVKRILAFWDPYADPQGIGYHTIQSLVAVSSGEGTGRGLGHGLTKPGYLPEDRTDFILAGICEELGIAGAAMVVTLFAMLVWAGYAVMRRERSPLLRLFTLGAISTVALQAIINLAVVTGMAPTKGIALPLLSSGGTGWLLTAFSL